MSIAVVDPESTARSGKSDGDGRSPRWRDRSAAAAGFCGGQNYESRWLNRVLSRSAGEAHHADYLPPPESRLFHVKGSKFERQVGASATRGARTGAQRT